MNCRVIRSRTGILGLLHLHQRVWYIAAAREGPTPMPANRRQFLAATAAVTLPPVIDRGLNKSPAADAPSLLPTVKLGPHTVTRMIVGGNPVYDHSHFNKLFSKHMTDWHTPERVMQLLKRCEQAGINTFQNSYEDRTLADVDLYRSRGGTMHWLCL